MMQSSNAKKKTGTKGMLSGNGRRTRSLSQPGTGSASGGPQQQMRDGEFRLAVEMRKDVRYNGFNAMITTAMLLRQKTHRSHHARGNPQRNEYRRDRGSGPNREGLTSLVPMW